MLQNFNDYNIIDIDIDHNIFLQNMVIRNAKWKLTSK